MSSFDAVAVGRRVLAAESAALTQQARDLDESFVRAVDILFAAKGRIACTGIGKSGHVAGLADAGASDAALGGEQDVHGADEGLVQVPGLLGEGGGFGGQHPAADGDGVEAAHGPGATAWSCRPRMVSRA